MPGIRCIRMRMGEQRGCRTPARARGRSQTYIRKDPGRCTVGSVVLARIVLLSRPIAIYRVTTATKGTDMHTPHNSDESGGRGMHGNREGFGHRGFKGPFGMGGMGGM